MFQNIANAQFSAPASRSSPCAFKLTLSSCSQYCTRFSWALLCCCSCLVLRTRVQSTLNTKPCFAGGAAPDTAVLRGKPLPTYACSSTLDHHSCEPRGSIFPGSHTCYSREMVSWPLSRPHAAAGCVCSCKPDVRVPVEGTHAATSSMVTAFHSCMMQRPDAVHGAEVVWTRVMHAHACTGRTCRNLLIDTE